MAAKGGSDGTAAPDSPENSAKTSEAVATVGAGYAFTGPALDLGALVVDGTGHPEAQIRIPLGMLNRHGLVAGATGTGKTKTLQLIAEQLSAQGVPVFLADIKGDVSGIAQPGEANDKVTSRAADVGQDWQPHGYPCEFFSLGGLGPGIPIRATITSFGPTLLAKILDLNETQESSLGLVFHFADQRGLELLDLKDLRAVIQFLTSDEGKEELKNIGGLSAATAGVTLRSLITLENSGGDVFFGEPEFDTAELLRTTPDGKGLVSVLELPAVQDKPQLFSTFLMWLLADLFADLPEVGDPDRPKLVFFFDEAHLLFTGASKAFLTAITQTVRLIRSKGVGIFFVTQTPKDVPSDVLAQLGNRVQHALRAFTPEDAKALKATVSTFPKSSYDLEEVLTQMGTGEAVVTVLSEKGAPTPVAWTRLRAPESLMAQIDPAAMQAIVNASPLLGKYGTAIDRESAYEKLTASQQAAAEAAAAQAEAEQRAKAEAPSSAPSPAPSSRRQKQEPSAVESVLKNSAVKGMLNTAVREITRSLFGTAKRRR
ncbi:helicase HerA-like domain-containing protein [Streptodolium elevatio]